MTTAYAVISLRDVAICFVSGVVLGLVGGVAVLCGWLS